jgi:hypothetical protein
MKPFLLFVFSSLILNVLGQAIFTTSATYNMAWQKFTGSSSILGLTHNKAKPLQYNTNVNVVSFTHLKNTTYTSAPFNFKNDVIVMVSNNKGLTWDSTCIWSDTTNRAMFPQGAIYSAPTNTNASNSYLIANGITINNNGNITGNFYASKQRSLVTNSVAPSSIPPSQYFFSNTLSVGGVAKHDFACSNMIATNDGVIHNTATLANNINATTLTNYGLRGGAVIKGFFSAGAFSWVTDTIIPTTILRSDGSKQLYPYMLSAFNEQGTVGYVVFIGARSSSLACNTGWQPIVYKTTNSGATWSLLPAINFNLPLFAPVLNGLTSISTNSSVVIPQFSVLEGIDIAVGFNGSLNIVAALGSTKSSHIDSLHLSPSFGTEGYKWKHTTGKRPYIYNFFTSATGGWNYILVDSLGSELPGKTPTSFGYVDNTWDADANGNKVSSGARIQISRGNNDRLLTITYADSDSLLTGKKWNTAPNIYAKVYDTQNGGLINNRLNLTNQTPININIANKAFFHTVSPRLINSLGTISPYNTVLNGCLNISTADISMPITVSNNTGLQQNSKVDHWYSTASFSITSNVAYYLSTASESLPSIKEVSCYPNPVSTNLTIELNTSVFDSYQLQVLNYLGQRILVTKLSGLKTEFDVSYLPKGIYFVRLFKNGEQKVFKIVKE